MVDCRERGWKAASCCTMSDRFLRDSGPIYRALELEELGWQRIDDFDILRGHYDDLASPMQISRLIGYESLECGLFAPFANTDSN